MTAAFATDWFRDTLWAAVVISAPPVIAIVIVGMIIAILQAATSINDQAVAFGPKALAAMSAIIVSSTWILSRLSMFLTQVIETIGNMPK